MTDEKRPLMKIPTIHRNGTPWKALLEPIIKAGREVRRAEEALRAAWPNGRDYYPQGPEALPEAVRQWEAMQIDLVSVRLRLEQIADGIWDGAEDEAR